MSKLAIITGADGGMAIMKSVENINLDACLGYVQKGVRHHFMDEYNER